MSGCSSRNEKRTSISNECTKSVICFDLFYTFDIGRYEKEVSFDFGELSFVGDGWVVVVAVMVMVVVVVCVCM